MFAVAICFLYKAALAISFTYHLSRGALFGARRLRFGAGVDDSSGGG
jgi:hypothetical protein